MSQTTPRHGMPSPRLPEAEFKARFRNQFQDPAFDGLAGELDRLTNAGTDIRTTGKARGPAGHTARLLTRVAPLVLVDETFALKDNTAINLFIRDMPRLSVDLDLAFPDHTLPHVTVGH